MKRVILAAIFAVAAGVAGADPVEGVWRTQPNDDGNTGNVQIAPCGAKFCGTLIKSFDSAGKPMASENIGKLIVWDMEPEGDGKFGNGSIWDSAADKIYNSKMTLEGDVLKVSGCVLFVCKKQTWTRVQ